MTYGRAGQSWQVKKILTTKGRYWPYLLLDGVPRPLPTLWITAVGRSGNANTAESYLRDVKLLYEIADSHGFQVEERLRDLVGFKGAELRAITSRLAKTKSDQPASRATCMRRAESIKSFLTFTFEYYKHQRDLNLIEQAQVDRNCSRLCKAVARNLRISSSVGPGSKTSSILSLDEVSIVARIVHPNSAINPFHVPAIRFRNYCMFRLVWATGMRRSELVLLELDDVRLGGSPTVRIKKPSVVSQQKRRDGASMKTLGREVPISLELAALLEEYREKWRLMSMVPGRASTAFFLSERDGRRLSAYSFNKIVDTIARVPAAEAIGKRLHPHGMRATAVTSIRRRIVESEGGNTVGLTDALAYVGGWVQRSPMVAHYTRAAISEHLAKTLRADVADQVGEADESNTN